MLHAKQTLSVKITTMLLVFFLVALTAIGLTLYVSWQLEGASAAVNDAGSLRMRTYRIAHHLSHPPVNDLAYDQFVTQLRREVDEVGGVDAAGSHDAPDVGERLAGRQVPGDADAAERVADHEVAAVGVEAAFLRLCGDGKKQREGCE